MEQILWNVEYADEARLLSDALKQLGERLLQARSASDIDSIGNQAIEVIRALGEAASKHRAAVIAFAAGRNEYCVYHDFRHEPTCIACEHIKKTWKVLA